MSSESGPEMSVCCGPAPWATVEIRSVMSLTNPTRRSAHAHGPRATRGRRRPTATLKVADATGLSRANLYSMRSFADAWPADAITQPAVGQLGWGQVVDLLTKLDDRAARDWCPMAPSPSPSGPAPRWPTTSGRATTA